VEAFTLFINYLEPLKGVRLNFAVDSYNKNSDESTKGK